MYSVSVKTKNEQDRVFIVLVQDNTVQRYTYRVRVSPKTVDQFDLADDELPDVIENAFHFLLQRKPPKEILPSFELMTIAVYFPEFTPGKST